MDKFWGRFHHASGAAGVALCICSINPCHTWKAFQSNISTSIASKLPTSILFIENVMVPTVFLIFGSRFCIEKMLVYNNELHVTRKTFCKGTCEFRKKLHRNCYASTSLHPYRLAGCGYQHLGMFQYSRPIPLDTGTYILHIDWYPADPYTVFKHYQNIS